MVEEYKKTCFVIAPIGEPESDTRERSDLILNHIIQPALEPFGYEAIRADNIDRPGIITTQVIQHVLDAPLVIADLTERNPNVFYELAIRHYTRKPFIQIMQEGQGIPFDVAATRIIFVDHNHLGKAAEARDKIKAQIESLEENPDDLESPISTSIDLQRIRQSEVPQDRLLMESLSALIRSELSNFAELVNIRGNITQQDIHSAVEEAVTSIRALEWRPYQRNVQAIRDVARHGTSTNGFLILLSLFREHAPWVYELGMEAYRKAMENDYTAASGLFADLLRSIELTASLLPRNLIALRDDLQMQFEEINLPF